MTRLVAVDSHVFQPRKQRLDGSEAILSHLKRLSDGGNLLQGAAHLMRATRSDDERSFEAVDGEWVPVHVRPADAHLDSNPKQRAALESVLTDLRAELLVLRASHQRLRDRVAALEARVEGTPVLDRRSARADLLTSPARFPGVRSGGEAHPAFKPPAHAGPAEQQSELGLATGTEQDLIAALQELFGADPGYAISSTPVPSSHLERLGLYGSLLIDESGRDVGVILVHVLASAELGGRSIGLSENDRLQQARSGELSAEVLQAMTEICYALTRAISKTAKARTVRCTPLEAFQPDQLGWLDAAHQHLALSAPLAGTLWILGR